MNDTERAGVNELVNKLNIKEERIVDLEKENAKLEGKLADLTSEYYELENLKNNEINKAKEIIKKFSEFVNNEVEYDPEHPQEHTDLWNELCKEAEQFLKEEEK